MHIRGLLTEVAVTGFGAGLWKDLWNLWDFVHIKLFFLVGQCGFVSFSSLFVLSTSKEA